MVRIAAKPRSGRAAGPPFLWQLRPEELDLLLQLLQLPVQHALVLAAVGVLDALANIAALEFQAFDLGNRVGLRIVNGAHMASRSSLPTLYSIPPGWCDNRKSRM